jgi:hypothetical protein
VGANVGELVVHEMVPTGQEDVPCTKLTHPPCAFLHVPAVPIEQPAHRS